MLKASAKGLIAHHLTGEDSVHWHFESHVVAASSNSKSNGGAVVAVAVTVSTQHVSWVA
jgi:hypothetical protein